MHEGNPGVSRDRGGEGEIGVGCEGYPSVYLSGLLVLRWPTTEIGLIISTLSAVAGVVCRL